MEIFLIKMQPLWRFLRVSGSPHCLDSDMSDKLNHFKSLSDQSWECAFHHCRGDFMLRLSSWELQFLIWCFFNVEWLVVRILWNMWRKQPVRKRKTNKNSTGNSLLKTSARREELLHLGCLRLSCWGHNQGVTEPVPPGVAITPPVVTWILHHAKVPFFCSQLQHLLLLVTFRKETAQKS